MDVRLALHSLLLALAEYFAAEPAAVSVETERFGTITRADVPRLLSLIEGR